MGDGSEAESAFTAKDPACPKCTSHAYHSRYTVSCLVRSSTRVSLNPARQAFGSLKSVLGPVTELDIGRRWQDTLCIPDDSGLTVPVTTLSTLLAASAAAIRGRGQFGLRGMRNESLYADAPLSLSFVLGQRTLDFDYAGMQLVCCLPRIDLPGTETLAQPYLCHRLKLRACSQ